MAYTDDAVKAKLSALNETQESIVTVAQWVMFHRRHADKTAILWLQKLKDSGSSKRLNLIYLANEVVQQSKARKKEDFLTAFSPIVAEATASAYRGATNEVQQKVRRVVEVWKMRQIFDGPIQEAVEARINEIDKTKSSGKKSFLGGGAFSGSNGPSAPMEIQPLIPLQNSISKAVLSIASHSNDVQAYDKLMDPNAAVPSYPVHAARLSALVKSLANAEGAVSQSIQARRSIIEELDKLLDANRTALASEEAQQNKFSTMKSAVESKKREVEDEILRKLPSDSPDKSGSPEENEVGASANGQGLSVGDAERPQVEELTPPGMETLTPIGSPTPADEPYVPPDEHPMASMDFGSSIPSTHLYPGSREDSPAKRRRVEDGFESTIGASARSELDNDVAELLRVEGGAAANV